MMKARLNHVLPVASLKNCADRKNLSHVQEGCVNAPYKLNPNNSVITRERAQT